jgi:putative ABC transport system permease protein
VRDERLDAELRFHIEELVADYMRQGIPEPEARRRAAIEFGGLDLAKEECRDVRRWAWLEHLLQEVRVAATSLRRSPRFTLTAAAALAVAIGSATAVFSFVDRTLFRPLPYRHQSRLVSIGFVAPMINTQDWMFAGTYLEWSRDPQAVEAITAWKGVNDCDRTDENPEALHCGGVEANFLPTLGVVADLGRNFTPEEDLPGADPAVMLSLRYFQSRFGGDPKALGKRITIDGVATRIIGVLPADFETPNLAPVDLLQPLQLRRDSQKQRILHVIGRVREGSSAASARDAFAAQFEQFVQSTPADFRKAVPLRLRVEGLREHQAGNQSTALWLLLGAVLCFQLISCANVGHLLFARTAARRQEFAVRASLGASRWRLARQLMIENTILGSAAGAAGCLLAFVLLRVFQTLSPDGAMRIERATIDYRAIAATVVLTLASIIAFGLAPVLERARRDDFERAAEVARSRHWSRSVLVALQMAFSAALLMATGLFAFNLWRTQQMPLGFNPEKVLAASFVLPVARYDSPEKQLGFFSALESKLAAMPGFTASAITDSVPPGGDPRSRPYVAMIGGGDSAAKGLQGIVKWRYVTAGYFETMNIPLTKGSLPKQIGSPQPIVMSESLARRMYGQDNPISQRIRLEDNLEVVAIAADVRNGGMQSAVDPEFYVLRRAAPTGVWQNQRPPIGWRRAIALVRTSLPDRAAIDLLQGALRELDPALPVKLDTMDMQVRSATARQRFQTSLLGFFGLAGLALAAFGLYGLTSLLATERAREIGVRIALGGTPGSIVQLIMRQSAVWAIGGIVVGLALVTVAMRSIRALLFGVDPFDAGVPLATLLILATVAVVGALVPSLRAAKADPMVALRQQ